jgi:hypothetical protein
MHIVPGTSGRIDQQEARGYLLGAVLGRGLLSRKEAAAAGLDARNKLTALDKRLAAEKEMARRAAGAARKAGGDAIEKQAAEAKMAREAVERERIALDLPQPLPPPKPVAGRKRNERPPPDLLALWCQRNQVSLESFKQDVRSLRYQRAQVERAWKPRTYRERKRLARTLELQKLDNRACTCDDHVLSFLCQAHVCYAFEAGTCDGTKPGPVGERSLPTRRIECGCMTYAFCDDEVDSRHHYLSPRAQLLSDEEYDIWGCYRLAFGWLAEPPGGRYGPGYCPAKAARWLTTVEVLEWNERHREMDRAELEKLAHFGKL